MSSRRPRSRGSARFRLLALLGCAAAPTPLQAETAVQLAPVQVTAGCIGQPLAEVPQPVTVVDADAIARAAPQVLTDLLRGQPGVFTQSSGPGQGIVIVRGLKGSELLHLVDGMRLNMSFFRNSPSQYVALVDPYNVERIELLRGPGAAAYGSDALGGVLQVFTPEHRFSGDALQARGGARALFGSADLAKIGRAYAALGRQDLSLAGGYTYQDYGQRETGNGGRQPYTDYSARAGDAKLLWSPAAGHELMLSGQWFEVAKLPRTFEIVGGPGGEGSGLPVYFEPNDRSFVHARYRIEAPLGFVERAELHLAQQIINDDRNRLVDAGTLEQEQNRSTLTGLTLQLQSHSGSARYAYGLDAYRDRIDSAKSRTDLESNAMQTRDPTFPDGAEERSLGVYLEIEWQALPRWLLTGGLRYSRIDTDLTATAVSPAADLSNDDYTAQLGSAYALSPSLRWTANLGRGFRAPNIFDLGTLGRRPNTSPQVINVPNPELDKETIVSVDSGLKWYRAGLQLEASVYQSWHDDRIEPREPTGNTVPDGQFGCSEEAGCIEVRSENLADTEFRGLEAGARVALRPQLAAYGTLNYTWGQETKRGDSRPANRVPPLNGEAGLVYQPMMSLRAESFLRFASRQERLDDDDQGDTRIDPDGTGGWATLNLRLGWMPQQQPLQLQLDLLNVFDKAYREHGSGIDAPGVGAVLSAALQLG